MTYWLIHTTTGYFQFDDEMGAPIHFLSGLLKHCNFISMTPIEAEDPMPAPAEDEPIIRVDVNPHSDGRTHLLGGFNTGDGRWTCHVDCWCKDDEYVLDMTGTHRGDGESPKPSEADEEEAADEHDRKVRKEREVNDGRPVGAIDHCGHCGSAGRRRSRLMKCSAAGCEGHCVDCLSYWACNSELEP
jgi:hypothetical protein